MAAPMAKIKQVFKVEKLNPQKNETIKSILHLITWNNKYTYWCNVFVGSLEICTNIILNDFPLPELQL